MKKYKLYLFDFDGTLFNTEKALTFIFQDSFKMIGVDIKQEEVMEISRKPLPETYVKYKGSMDGYDKFIGYVHDLVHSERSVIETECFPETKEFLKELKDKDIKSGVVTSNNTNHVKRILNHFDLSVDTFCSYVGNDITKITKPDPTPINIGIELSGLEIDRKDIVYVGDGINDTKAAINAGIDAILIDRKGEFPDSINYVKIKSLLELLK